MEGNGRGWLGHLLVWKGVGKWHNEPLPPAEQPENQSFPESLWNHAQRLHDKKSEKTCEAVAKGG